MSADEFQIPFDEQMSWKALESQHIGNSLSDITKPIIFTALDSATSHSYSKNTETMSRDNSM